MNEVFEYMNSFVKTKRNSEFRLQHDHFTLEMQWSACKCPD